MKKKCKRERGIKGKRYNDRILIKEEQRLSHSSGEEEIRDLLGEKAREREKRRRGHFCTKAERLKLTRAWIACMSL